MIHLPSEEELKQERERASVQQQLADKKQKTDLIAANYLVSFIPMAQIIFKWLR
jgi:hypothetical protein